MGDNFLYIGKKDNTEQWVKKEIAKKIWEQETTVILCQPGEAERMIRGAIDTTYYDEVHMLTKPPLFSDLVRDSGLSKESVAHLISMDEERIFYTNMEYLLIRLMCEIADTNRFFSSLDEIRKLPFGKFLPEAEKADKELTDMMLANAAEAQKFYEKVSAKLYNMFAIRDKELGKIRRDVSALWVIPIDPTAGMNSLFLECLYHLTGTMPMSIFINADVKLSQWRSLYTSKLQRIATYIQLPGLGMLKAMYPQRYQLLASMIDHVEFTGEQMISSDKPGSTEEEILSYIAKEDEVNHILHALQDLQDEDQLLFNRASGYIISRPVRDKVG